MRLVGTLEDESQARRFVNYLLTLEIPGAVRAGSSGFGVWIEREDQVERGRAEFEAFRSAPDDDRYRAAVRPASEIREKTERIERQHRKNTVELSGRLNTVSPRRCPVVHILIGACLFVAVISKVGENQARLRPFYFAPPRAAVEFRPVAEGSQFRLPTLVEVSAGLEPIRRGELWRLFTPMFIHYGLAHLVFNMMALYWFGGMVELRRNSWLLLALVLTAAPVSFFGQYLWDLQSHGADAISLPGGMSGVIYALFGYAWITGEYEPDSGLRLPSNTIVWMLMWLGLCMTGVAGPIANAAHVVGLMWGILFAVVPHLRARPA